MDISVGVVLCEAAKRYLGMMPPRLTALKIQHPAPVVVPTGSKVDQAGKITSAEAASFCRSKNRFV
jgi:hypothetical protein